jgi:L-2-hydroxyglutarate oxidase
MPARSFNIAIIGGGVVGAAVAREAAACFEDILLIEKEPFVGCHTSGRNSGVIHSGINSKPGTLKAKLCVEGNKELRRYCRERSLPMEQGGTLVVATDDSQISVLGELKNRSEKNGVPGVEILSSDELRRHEPKAKGAAGLYSPTGAIVDSLRLTQSLARDAEDRGVRIQLTQGVDELKETKHCVQLSCKGEVISAKLVINCAGLHADRLAHLMKVGLNYTVVPFRGEYFVVKKPGPPIVRSMIYPTPNLRFPFLGVHVTKTVTGKVLIGPNAVPAFGREAYRNRDVKWRDLFDMVIHKGFWNALLHNRDLVSAAWNELQNSCSRQHFWRQACELVEGLDLDDIALETRVGIRPQLIRSDGELVEDLVIETTPRSIHILNVVSPGMTSAIAFAKWFVDRISHECRWTGEPGRERRLISSPRPSLLKP